MPREPSSPGSLRRLSGLFLGILIRLWGWTYRVSVEFAEASASPAGSPRVFAFLHGQQMALTAARLPKQRAVLVSHSRDGDLQAGVMRALSFRVVRGSSSRGGAVALRSLARLVRSGVDAALAIDGPRGPRGKPKSGAAAVARLGRAALVPVASDAASKIVLRRTWDAFEIPLPFSRVAIVVGAVVPSDAGAAALELALAQARARASALVSSPPGAARNVPVAREESGCPVASR